MFDIIGVGALNLDYIATKRRTAAIEKDLISKALSRFDRNNERLVDEGEIDAALSQIGHSMVEPFLGGSAFNTLHSLACINHGFRLGFVGVAGDVDLKSLDFIDALNGLGIDNSLLWRRRGKRSGICVSYIADGERSLLTFPGANTEMAAHLKANFHLILNTLCQTQIVHVTSFLDNDTPGILLQLLSDAKAKSPSLKISIDPGHRWIADFPPSVHELLRLADFLFLNDIEFRLLGRQRPEPSISSAAAAAHDIFNYIANDRLLIIAKKGAEIWLTYNSNGQPQTNKYPVLVLPREMIEDATGAGDVFAAGFLAALLVPEMHLQHGVELGLRLARVKLLTPGSRSFDAFAGIFRTLSNEVALRG